MKAKAKKKPIIRLAKVIPIPGTDIYGVQCAFCMAMMKCPFRRAVYWELVDLLIRKFNECPACGNRNRIERPVSTRVLLSLVTRPEEDWEKQDAKDTDA